MGKEDGDEGERRGAERREGMEERGFIEAAGKSSVIALWWIRGMYEKWNEEGRKRKGRKVKFVGLLGAALNTGIINVV